MLVSSAKPVNFVRQIPRFTTKTLDLVDVVAGGDGFSGQRNRGIDPTTGKLGETQPVGFENGKWKFLVGDRRYHRVEQLPLVDGVFIPDGSRGSVQTDSAGHTYDGFAATSNETAGYVWAGGVVPSPPGDDNLRSIPAKLGGIDYSSPGHGVLFMHANKGITFDLGAIRRANPGCKLVRFHAAVGNTETARNRLAFVRRLLGARRRSIAHRRRGSTVATGVLGGGSARGQRPVPDIGGHRRRRRHRF